MSTVYRSRSRRRSGGGHTLPIIAVSSLLLALSLGGYFMYKQQIKEFFEGKPALVVYDNKEANSNLEQLLASLSGKKSELIALAENSRTRLGWINSDTTKRQMRWLLMERLIDHSEWDLAMTILPEVEQLATIEQLDRLAIAALRHNDVELQLRLDARLQNLAIKSPAKVSYLLQSIRRQAESTKRLNRMDETLNTLALLEIPVIQARLTDPQDAAEAAALLMLRADVSEVKAPILQKVRNILQGANWPACSATSELIIEEVSNAINDNPVLGDAALRNIESKLLSSRDAMFSSAMKPELLVQCYVLLGKTRMRLQDYAGASQALSMAEALAEGSGLLNEDFKLDLTRMHALVDSARGAIEEAKIFYRYLAEFDTDGEERFKAIFYLAQNSEPEQAAQYYQQAWDTLDANKDLEANSNKNREMIATKMAEYYGSKEDYLKEAEWLGKSVALAEPEQSDLANGVLYKLRIALAIAHRKALNDQSSINILKQVVTSMDALSEEDRKRMDEVDKDLYKYAVREYSRAHLLLGDDYTSKQLSRKIGEGLPLKKR